MRHFLHSQTGRRSALALALAAAGLTLAAAPALAQSVDEVTVWGHRGADGVERLSRAVDISDLDLRSDAGVREMQRRIRYTARDLCAELGETGGGSTLMRSCVDDAVRGAQRQARYAVAQARANAYYAWNAPYVGPTYVGPPVVAPSTGDYAPPASAVVPDYPPN